jgi:hypothetical protein
MWNEFLWDFQFCSEHFLRCVRVILGTSVACTLNFSLSAGRGEKLSVLSQHDAVLERTISFVVESAILADQNPKIISLGGHNLPPSPEGRNEKLFNRITQGAPQNE